MAGEKGRVTATTIQERVCVPHDPPVPLNIEAAIAGKSEWLSRELSAMDAELGLSYPPVDIIPVCWIADLDDGHSGTVPGRVTIGQRHGLHMYVVQICGAALSVRRFPSGHSFSSGHTVQCGSVSVHVAAP